MSKTNLLINGFGRIGRAVLRKIAGKKFIENIYINDLNLDTNNLIYTYNYDKLVNIFNRFPKIEKKKNNFFLGKKKIHFLKANSISNFNKIKDLDFILDCSGVSNNSKDWIDLSKKNKKIKFFYTFDHPLSEITLVIGANEKDLNSKHRFISTSICDATALAPFLKILNQNYSISHGNITTVHPVLNYQNILDGPSASWSFPGKSYSHYSLGRGVIDNLIPKPTTAIKVTEKSLSKINLTNINSFSYRVPTTIVGSADLSIVLKKNFSVDGILKIIKSEIKKQKYNIFDFNLSPKVSSDYFMNDFSLIYDHIWTTKNKNMLHAILWYDNENGYASRVVDQLEMTSLLN
jgi:glyceraldehyde 3-phosphate dehydrogenase